MPKRHDIPGFRFVSDTPPPSYQEILENPAIQYNPNLTNDYDENLRYIDEDPIVHGHGMTDKAQPVTERDRAKSNSSPAVFDDGPGGDEDVPDTFRFELAAVNKEVSQTSLGRNDSERRRSPLLKQPAYDFEHRRPSEVRRCLNLFKLLSKDLVDDDIEIDGETNGGDCVDGFDAVDGCADESCSNLTSFINKCPEDARGMIASYLSTGKITDIALNPNNFHLFLHVAIALNLRQLKEYCIKHYFEGGDSDQIEITGECTCVFAIEYEAQKGYQRSESVISENDDLSPPEYYIAFSKAHKTPDKVRVVVVNMCDKHKVLQRVIEKPLGHGFACCSIEKQDSPFILVSGGEKKSLNQVWRFDVIEGRWEKLAKLLHGRSSHVMTTCNGSLYVIGGKEASCIEEYDAKGKKWKEKASLVTPVYSAISVVHDQKIYIFGGTTPAGPVATVQCFDTVSNRVRKLDDLPCPVSNGQAVVFKDNIYIASGQGHMIIFETLCGISKLCSEQPIRRENFGMFVKNDRVYLVGGEVLEGEELPQCRYNTEKDCWTEKDSLNFNLPVYASCIIRYPRKCPVIPFDYSR